MGSRHTGEGGDVGDAARREVLEVELERLRRVLVDMMNGLAEQVLDQIQATRRAVDQTETLLTELGSASRVDDTSTSHVHMKQVVARIEDAIRDLPESSWDDFGQACTQLARTLHRLHANE